MTARIVHLIGPGGTRDEFRMETPRTIQYLERATLKPVTIPVRQYAVGGMVLLVAMRPDATSLDLALALLRPDVAETGQVIP